MIPLSAQELGTGLIFEPDRYEEVDLKPILVSRNYSSLPKAYSIKQYSPTPESQGRYGTCTAWASAFAARTISESIAIGRTDKILSSSNAYSPAFLYKSISNDPDCNDGVSIIAAMEFMKNEGIVKRLPIESILDFKDVQLSLFESSKRYPISDFVRLFLKWGVFQIEGDEKIIPVKKSIAEGKPVIIAFNDAPSFKLAYNRELWEPFIYENYNTIYSGHALCVVGYDDNKYGGAFEIQNSWGSNWGRDGYVWMRYADFDNWVREAYEIIENLTNFKEVAEFSASIKIEVYTNNDGMPVKYDQQGFYRTQSSYPSGTDFRFLMTNKHPSYVYAFSADGNTTRIERIFPLRGISPILDYSESTIAWPGEYDWIRLDQITGTDYLVVLYSKEALNIDEIEKRFANESGSFPERVARSVGLNFINYSNVQYNPNNMEFSTQSPNMKAVFGLLLAIDHN